MRNYQFLCDLQPEQLFRQTDRQTLNCRMSTKLTIVPVGKGDLFYNNNKKYIDKDWSNRSKVIFI